MLLGKAAKEAAFKLSRSEYSVSAGKILTSNYAGVVESTFGKGKVVYFPMDITTAIFRWNEPCLYSLVESALRQVASEPPPAEVRAPSIVQAMTHQQGNRMIIHLLNDISSMGRTQNIKGESLIERTEVIPIHDIELTFRNPALTTFTLVPGKLVLAPIRTNGLSIVRVPRLDYHCMVIAE